MEPPANPGRFKPLAEPIGRRELETDPQSTYLSGVN